MTTTTMTRRAPGDWREGRRLRAWELKQAKWSQRAIAEALGVTEGAVSQWMKRARDGGVEALRQRPAPGATPKLSPEQRAQLPSRLTQGAEPYGFIGEVWPRGRVATLIPRQFGVTYHPAHVRRLLRASGWSVQKPIPRASQRDETAIATWWQARWPARKKRAKRSMGRSSG